MAEKISGMRLRADMFVYNVLSSLGFSYGRYARLNKIEMRAQDTLRRLEQHRVHVRRKDVKLWARYVNQFGTYNKEHLLARLQNKVNYDLPQYLEKQSQGWLARHFGSSAVSYMSSEKLIEKYNKYINLCRKLRTSQRNKSLMAKARKIRTEAKNYAAAVVDGKININPSDYQALWSYFNVICYPPKQGDMPDLAKKKIEALQEQVHGAEQPKVAQQPKTKNNTAEKNTKRNRFSKLKIWMLGGVVALAGGGLTLKTCSERQAEKETQEPRKEVLAKTDNVVKSDTTVIDFTRAQEKNVVKPAEKNAVHVVSAAEVNQADSVQQIWNNYYDNTIEIISSAKTKSDVYQKIERQLADSVFVLPQNISKERLAYAYVIYKAYGVDSTIEAALEKSDKLSKSEQKRLFEDVFAAGEKGEGVKKMALARNNGRLSSYSGYDRASHSLQKKHKQNLYKLSKLKHSTRGR